MDETNGDSGGETTESEDASCDLNHDDYVGNYDEEWNKEYFKPQHYLERNVGCITYHIVIRQRKSALFLLGLHLLMFVLDGNTNVNKQCTVIVILE